MLRIVLVVGLIAVSLDLATGADISDKDWAEKKWGERVTKERAARKDRLRKEASEARSLYQRSFADADVFTRLALRKRAAETTALAVLWDGWEPRMLPSEYAKFKLSEVPCMKLVDAAGRPPTFVVARVLPNNRYLLQHDGQRYCVELPGKGIAEDDRLVLPGVVDNWGVHNYVDQNNVKQSVRFWRYYEEPVKK